MDFGHTTIQPKTSAKCISPYTNRNRNKIDLPNVDKVMMLVSDCVKHPGGRLQKKRESSLSHILFPSRCPPPVTKTSKEEKAKIHSLVDSFAAANIAPVAIGSPKRSIHRTLHRRNKHVFVSSHSPTKSSSPSKARSSTKATYIRKHHRRHNLALNATDFEILISQAKRGTAWN
jgi:hypothetical protein